MKTNIIDDIIVVNSETPLITDRQSTIDFITSFVYENNINKIAINKAAISRDFFKLSTGLAGEVAQQFTNWRCRIAIIGDFSEYTSKPLLDYMYECNKGQTLYFVNNEDEAINYLGR